jgi:hypothetical protein
MSTQDGDGAHYGFTYPNQGAAVCNDGLCPASALMEEEKTNPALPSQPAKCFQFIPRLPMTNS